MPRKKREGVTTPVRYKSKMRRIGMALSDDDPVLASQYAEALFNARSAGYGPYKAAYDTVKAVLTRHQVSSVFWGIYRAFAFEVLHKVQFRKEATLDEIIRKWEDRGLDADVLREIGEALVQVFEKGPETPAAKT